MTGPWTETGFNTETPHPQGQIGAAIIVELGIEMCHESPHAVPDTFPEKNQYIFSDLIASAWIFVV